MLGTHLSGPANAERLPIRENCIASEHGDNHARAGDESTLLHADAVAHPNEAAVHISTKKQQCEATTLSCTSAAETCGFIENALCD